MLDRAMDIDKVDTIIQYALAVCRCVHDDDWMMQSLGPIHLIKYVYLADLAYAEKHGKCYTDTDWSFLNFGPFSPSLFSRIHPALQEIDADEKIIPSKYQNDFQRWRIVDYESAESLRNKLEKKIPLEVALSVQNYIKKYGNCTSELLHVVYSTPPMLQAAPGENLHFGDAKKEAHAAAPKDEVKLSHRQIKKKRHALEEARRCFAEKASQRIKERRACRAAQQIQQYDVVFEKGIAALDALAGPELGDAGGILEFDDSIWKAPARTEIEDD